MSEPVEPIDKNLLRYERMAMRIKLAAAVVYGRDRALEAGDTDEQFAHRLGVTVPQLYRMILSILKTNVDDLADLCTALETRMVISSRPLPLPTQQPAPTAENAE